MCFSADQIRKHFGKIRNLSSELFPTFCQLDFDIQFLIRKLPLKISKNNKFNECRALAIIHRLNASADEEKAEMIER